MEGCSSSQSGDSSEILEQFCAVTGATHEIGKPLLEACNWNLQMAIGMHMDSGGQLNPDSPGGGVASASDGATGALEDVRAPIPQKRETLVDNSHFVPVGRRTRAGAGNRSVFDSFRDFQAETKQAEERARRGEAPSTGPPRKRHTLEDLFRPPVDLIHKGSFNSAKEAGTTANKWILVNIQNVKEFNCQVLNRDVWSNTVIREIIKRHFLFWQVYSDSEDGKRYMQFYNIIKWPYMAIIDPQTGEKFIEWNNVDMKTVLELMNTFLAEHPCPDNSMQSPPCKKARTENSIVDASEDSQLEAAIKASLQQTKATVTSAISISSDDSDIYQSSDDELETFSDSGGSQSGSANAQSKPKPGKTQANTNNQVTVDSSSSSSASGSDSDSGSIVITSKSSRNKSKNNRQTKNGGKGKKLLNSHGVVKNGTSQAPVVDVCSSEDSRSLTITSDESRESTATSSAAVTGSWKDYLGSEEDEKTKLLIRYPDGKREPLTVPCSSKLRAVVMYLSENKIDLDEHELVTNFPRRNISAMDLDQTLKESGLHPQETVFIQTIS